MRSPVPSSFPALFGLTGALTCVLQEELAELSAQQQQLTASELATRQQLAASEQARKQARAACASADAELHRLSTALQDSQAQLALAHENEAQVIPTHTPRCPVLRLGSSSCCAHTHTHRGEDTYHVGNLAACHM